MIKQYIDDLLEEDLSIIREDGYRECLNFLPDEFTVYDSLSDYLEQEQKEKKQCKILKKSY